MKVTPANQSLILAGESARPERAPVAGPRTPGFEISDALRAVTNGAVLKRVTIVAGRPDTNVVLLQADYSSSTAAASSGSQPPEPNIVSYDTPGTGIAVADPAEVHDASGGRVAEISSYLSPVEQYARMQRGLGDTPAAALLDVYA